MSSRARSSWTRLHPVRRARTRRHLLRPPAAQARPKPSYSLWRLSTLLFPFLPPPFFLNALLFRADEPPRDQYFRSSHFKRIEGFTDVRTGRKQSMSFPTHGNRLVLSQEEDGHRFVFRDSVDKESWPPQSRSTQIIRLRTKQRSVPNQNQSLIKLASDLLQGHLGFGSIRLQEYIQLHLALC